MCSVLLGKLLDFEVAGYCNSLVTTAQALSGSVSTSTVIAMGTFVDLRTASIRLLYRCCCIQCVVIGQWPHSKRTTFRTHIARGIYGIISHCSVVAKCNICYNALTAQ